MRETSVPLVNLASLIANEPAPEESRNTAVLARCGETQVAFEVDDVDAVGGGSMEPVPEAWRLPWVDGMVREDGALVPIIDLDVLVERLSAPAHGE